MHTDSHGRRLTPGKITDKVRAGITTAQLRNELAGSNKAKTKAAAKRSRK
jgi:hypothetical protein